MICCIDVLFKTGLTVDMVGNQIYSQTCLKWYIYTTNRGKPTIYTVKPDLKGTSIQQIVVVRFHCIYGWFTTICYMDAPFKAGLTIYMVGLPRFVSW
jgi:hypothetical protein